MAETIIDSARVENDYLVALGDLYPNGFPDGVDKAQSSLFLLKGAE